MCRLTLKVLFLLPLFFPPLPCQSTRMVLDICRKSSWGSPNSYPGKAAWFKGWWYFHACDPQRGFELWRSKGTGETTELFYEFTPGPSGAAIWELTPAGGKLFFRVERNGKSRLWVTDGTGAGTREVKTGGEIPDRPVRLFSWKGILFFAAKSPGHGEELWRSDGTGAGTFRIKDINPGPAGSSPAGFAALGSFLFFKASDGVHGLELWETDGTEKGTVLVKDVYPGPGDGLGRGRLVPAGGTLFFPGRDKKHGEELWKTDGTLQGTLLVKDARKGAEGSKPLECGAPLGNELVFTCDDGVHGMELWRSDGTEKGTSLIEDLFPGFGGCSPMELVSAGDGVFFSAIRYYTGPYDRARDLWRVGADFKIRHWVSFGVLRDVFHLVPLGDPKKKGQVLFLGEDFDKKKGEELWIAGQESPAGTKILKDIAPGKVSSSPLFFSPDRAGRVFFRAFTTAEGIEPWVTDGTAGGTKLVKDIFRAPLPTIGSLPSNITNVYGTLFFSASDWDHGVELWKSDGTAAGTTMVKDIRPKSRQGTYLACFTPLGATLLFRCDDGLHGRELWRSDGTAAGTYLVKDILPGKDAGGRPLNSDPLSSAAELNGILLFSARGPEGEELWRTDGTGAGTYLVKDIFPGPGSSHPRGLRRAGNRVFFQADGGKRGKELWITDGTAGGTRLVKDIRPGSGGSAPFCLREMGGTLFFLADDGVHGVELWRSDGSGKGTILVKDINPGKGKGAWNLEAVGDHLYFAGNDGVHGRELWKSDGTGPGTVLVKDIHPGAGWSSPALFTSLGKACLFRCNSAGKGDFELWRTDGTSGGTFLLKDIRTGPEGSNPFFLAAVGSRFVYFAADDGLHGRELWRTDGTTSGTVLVKDILPGKASSYCSMVTQCKGILYFRAADSLHGQELWMSDPGGTSQDFGPGTAGPGEEPRLDATDPVPGKEMTFEGRGCFPGGTVLLVLGAPASRPFFPFPGFPVHLDLASPWTWVSPGRASVRGRWKRGVSLPPGSVPAGAGFLGQAWVLGVKGGLLFPQATNGLYLRVGF